MGLTGNTKQKARGPQWQGTGTNSDTASTIDFRVEIPDSGHTAENEPARPAFENEMSVPILLYRLPATDRLDGSEAP